MIILTGLKVVCLLVGTWVVVGKITDNLVIPTIQGIRDGIREGRKENRAKREKHE